LPASDGLRASQPFRPHALAHSRSLVLNNLGILLAYHDAAANAMTVEWFINAKPGDEMQPRPVSGKVAALSVGAEALRVPPVGLVTDRIAFPMASDPMVGQ
jgi:hypothetical protein